MIETSSQAWIGFFLLLGVSSLCGLAISQRLPWSAAARQAGFSWSAGFALAPLITGLIAVMALAFLPGASHTGHLAFIAAALIALGMAVWRGGKDIAYVRKTKITHSPGEWVLSIFIVLWIGALLVNTIFLPLNQNDPLEYATVGRILFEARDLAAYPAIHPEQTASGFYGPWTHPPLYVALVYLANLLQGHADTPGLMRMFAPWCAIAGAGVVFTLGYFIKNRLAALWAALVFISTPMLFLGSGGAMIDALPVLGMALSLLLVTGLEASPAKRGACIGLALGLAVWTHSQAILFIPVMLAVVAMYYGLRNWRCTAYEWGGMLAVTLLVGVWPYIRNMLLFGSPISDTPAISAISELKWAEFFQFSRGLDTTTAIIQYGIFKGWFAFKFYGLSFWLMLAGVVVFTLQLNRAFLMRMIENGARGFAKPWQYLWISIGVVLVYHMGVIASVMLGLDLMIKNERYMLVILPAVAVIAGFGIQHILERGSAKFSDPEVTPGVKELVFVCFAGLLVLLVLQFAAIGFYYHWYPIIERNRTDSLIAVKEPVVQNPEKSRLGRLLDAASNTQTARWMRNLPADAVVLSLRPSDMYYADRRMISYLDPRMAPVYREPDPVKTAALLKKMGVRYLHLPNYDLPVYYNSALKTMFERPDLTKLIYDAGLTQVYELTNSRARAILAADLTPGKVQWSWWRQFDIGGRQVRSILQLPAELLEKDYVSKTTGGFGLGHRDFSTMLANGIGSDLVNVKPDTLQKVEGNREYQVALDVKGRGYVRILLLQIPEYGEPVIESISGVERMGEIVLSDPGQVYHFSRRFRTAPGTKYIRIGVEHMGYSEVMIEKAGLYILK